MAGEDQEREPTFAELFEANPETPSQQFRLGDLVSGKIVKISKDSIFVDLGGKSEGVVDLLDFADADGKLRVKEGDRLELRVTSVSDGICLSSGLKVRGEQALDVIRQAFENELPVEGKVSGVNKGGLDVDISGHRAFCPVSQIDLGFCEDPGIHVGQRYSFRIQEFRERGRNIIVSRRALLEEEREKTARAVLETLKPGDVRKGTVTRLMNFGAFVDIGGVEAMVHISEMAHYRLNHPSELLRVGQDVQVRIEAFDPGSRGGPRISCSIKALEPTPWESGLGFQDGAVVTGKVTKLMDFGAFVELSRGVEGLVHVSEISHERVSHPKKFLREGQEVTVRVLGIDHERKRISLSLKEAQHLQPAAPGSEEAGQENRVRLSHKAVKEHEESKEVQTYMVQGKRSGAMATLGDLFKGLKLPEK